MKPNSVKSSVSNSIDSPRNTKHSSDLIILKPLSKANSSSTQSLIPKLKLNHVTTNVNQRHRKSNSLSFSKDLETKESKRFMLNTSISSSRLFNLSNTDISQDPIPLLNDAEKLEKQIKADLAFESKINYFESKRSKEINIALRQRDYKENAVFYRQQDIEFQNELWTKQKIQKAEEKKRKYEEYIAIKIARFEAKIKAEVELKNEIKRQEEWSKSQKEIEDSKKEQARKDRLEKRKSQLEFWNCQKRSQYEDQLRQRNEISYISIKKAEEKFISTRKKSQEVRSRLKNTLKLLN